MKDVKNSRGWKLLSLILTGIWLVLLLILNASIGPGFPWQRIVILSALVLLLAEAWMVWYAGSHSVSKAFAISGWILAAALWIISINLGNDMQKSTSLILNGTGLRVLVSFYLSVVMFIPFWWTIRAVAPSKEQKDVVSVK